MFHTLLLPLLFLQVETTAFTKDAVVKISCQYQEPDFNQPWTKKPSTEGGGSGVILNSGWVVTNAHVVRYATRIYIQPHGSDERYEAEARFIAYRDDLALLKPKDSNFFNLFPSVSLDVAVPSPGSSIQVLGYPKGGQELSMTEGVVSRIQYHRNLSNGYAGLVIEIDAAVNHGNSGGPVVSNGNLIAIVMSGLGKDDAEGINWNIPAAKLQSLIDDCEDGNHAGAPVARVCWIKAENQQLRAYLGLSASDQGVLISPNPQWSPENLGIQKWDFLMEIAGHPVDNFGKVMLDNETQVEWMHFVSRETANEKGQIPIKIIRKGVHFDTLLRTSLASDVPWVIRDANGTYPSYYIYGPLVFIEVPRKWRLNWFFTTRGHLISRRVATMQRQANERLVMATGKLLDHSISKGYEHVPGAVLLQVNGKPILNLKDLVATLEAFTEGDVLLEFDPHNLADARRSPRPGAQNMVFRHQEVLKTREDILEEASIRRHYSKDLADFIR